MKSICLSLVALFAHPLFSYEKSEVYSVINPYNISVEVIRGDLLKDRKGQNADLNNIYLEFNVNKSNSIIETYENCKKHSAWYLSELKKTIQENLRLAKDSETMVVVKNLKSECVEIYQSDLSIQSVLD